MPRTHHSVAAIAGDWADRVISVFSFSKSHAMSGLRVGYVVTRSAVQERMQKLLRCTINGVNSLAQWGAVAASPGPQDTSVRCARSTLRRDMLLDALAETSACGPSRRAAQLRLGRARAVALLAAWSEWRGRALGEVGGQRHRQRARRRVRRAMRRRHSVRVQLRY